MTVESTRKELSPALEELASDLVTGDKADDRPHAMYVIMCEAARQYLGDGYSRTDLWSTVQSLQENLEDGLVGASSDTSLPMVQFESIAAIETRLRKSTVRRSLEPSHVTGEDLLGLVKSGALKNGTRLYMVGRKYFHIVEVLVESSTPGAAEYLKFRAIDGSGTPIGGTYWSLSKVTEELRGTTVNPYDMLRTSWNETLRSVVNQLRKSNESESGVARDGQ